MPYDIPSQQPTDTDDDLGLNMSAIFSDDTSRSSEIVDTQEIQSDPRLSEDTWKSGYRTLVTLSANLFSESNSNGHVDVEDKEGRAGACLQNALRTMEILIQKGIPKDCLRAVYIANVDEEHRFEELAMLNSGLRKEEKVEGGEADNTMSYHVTVIYNPHGFSPLAPLRDLQVTHKTTHIDSSSLKDTDVIHQARVFDLTTKLEYQGQRLWGSNFSDFSHLIFQDDELSYINTNLVGFVLDKDELEIMNENLQGGKGSTYLEMVDRSEAIVLFT